MDFQRMKILDIPQSGSAGNLTSSRNRSGQYQRQRSIPTQPRTTAQINQRARLTSQSAAWRGLSDAQRASWNGFAASFTVVNSLGQSINLTGHQCFVKVNSVNLLIGDAAVSVPPALPSFVACTATAIACAAGTPAFTISGTTPASGTKHMVYASPQGSAGATFNGTYRYLCTVTTYTAGSYNLLSAYTGKFGTLVAGKKVFVKIVQSQAGMQDNGTLFTAIVAA